jgi:hypothetical protein
MSMKSSKSDFFSLFLILIISLLFVLELFLFPGRPASFDANFHITNIAQFSSALRQGEFPVIWMNNFANYGLPMGFVAHQLTNYLGGLITILTNDPTLTYNLLVFIGILFSSAFFYSFLRLYFSSLASLLGTFIFTFTPYRIFNIYVRGAMPEVFSALFLPLILISLYLLIVKKKQYALFLLTLFIMGLTLAHPMMLVIYSFIFIPYLIYLLIISSYSASFKLKIFIVSSLSMLIGIFICSYFFIPLNLEIKYFYYGLEKNHLNAGSYLSLTNYFSYSWPYFTNAEIFPRGHIVLFGFLESVILLIGFIYTLFVKVFKKTVGNINFLYFVLFCSLLIIFITTKFSSLLFQNLFFLNSVQFQWRFLSSLIFLPPIIVAFLYDKFPKKILFALVTLIACALAFPQLYGKNYNLYSTSSYFYSKENAHSVLMNTIWTGKSEDYPDKKNQADVIQGEGEIVASVIKNSSRKYEINAKTPLTLVDKTFYFPGWNVYVDGVKTNIEFQNPNYRGVITYNVPMGKHLVYLTFEDTKVRLLGKIMSIVFLSGFIIIFFLRRNLYRFIRF